MNAIYEVSVFTSDNHVLVPLCCRNFDTFKQMNDYCDELEMMNRGLLEFEVEVLVTPRKVFRNEPNRFSEDEAIVDGVRYVPLEDKSCKGCAFVEDFGGKVCLKNICSPSIRKDKRSVYWIKADF